MARESEGAPTFYLIGDRAVENQRVSLQWVTCGLALKMLSVMTAHRKLRGDNEWETIQPRRPDARAIQLLSGRMCW
jgi:hypothetical protein